jgi:hypothetical protein
MLSAAALYLVAELTAAVRRRGHPAT